MALDVNELSAQEIIDKADSLSDAEKTEAAAAEREGKNRKTVLAALEGGDGEERRSGTGRLLQPQEADPRAAVKANIGEQIVRQHQELTESDATPESSHEEPLIPGRGAGGDATGASTPAGTGAAPAAGAGGDAGRGGTAGV